MNRPLRRALWGSLPLVAAALLVAPPAAAQEQAYQIRGTVLDATTQRGLDGTAVRIAGTQLGTLSDREGRFALTARIPAGEYEVRITRIGYAAASRTIELDVELEIDLGTIPLTESAVELDEIVVTGVGAPAERRRVGNVVESVVGAAINEAPAAPAIDAALQGKVTGAVISQNHGQPGGGTSIRLRGTSSIYGGAEPLIVVDGVIVDNNSSALIGLGANAPRGGAAMSNRLSDIAPADIERVEIVKGAAAAALYGSQANAGVIQIFTRRGQEGAPRISVRSELSVSEAPDVFELLMDPRAGAGDVAFVRPDLGIGDPIERFNMIPEVFRTAVGTTNQFSLSGGANGSQYYLSGRWVDEQGTIRGQGNENVSARVRLNQQITDRMDVAVSANYIQRETNFVPEGEQTQGVLTGIIFTPTSWDFRFDPETGRFPYSPILVVNPLDVTENWIASMNVDRFVGSAQANWRPFDGLTVNYTFGLDEIKETNTYLQPPASIGAAFTGEIQNPKRDIRRYNNDLNATHTTLLSPTVDLTTTAGFRHTFVRNNIVRAAARDLPPEQRTVQGAVELASQSITEIMTVGGFIQPQVGINDVLTITGALNLEAASTFGPDERWQLFPRLGLSYVASEGPFWPAGRFGEVVSSLRLRTAWGQTGSQPPGAYIRFDNYIPTAYAGRAGLVASTVAGNPELRPERQNEIEAGFDVGLLSDRAQLEFTFYNQITDDIIMPVPLPSSSGFSSQWQNVGELRNRGVELSLATLNVSRPDWSWRSRISYSTNSSQVRELAGDADRIVFDYLNAVMVGEPVGVFWGGIYARDEQGNIMHTEAGLPMRAQDTTFVNGEMLISPASRVIGNPEPDFSLSMSNDFTIGGNLQLGFLLDGRFGNDVANFTRRISEFFGAHPNNAREIDYVVTDGAEGVPPGYYLLNTTRHVIFEEWIEDGSFVKLREASIRYRFDQPWIQRLGASSLDLRIAGRNLATWTNYSGVDPEINLFSANTISRGVEFGTTPVPRTFVFGVTANF